MKMNKKLLTAVLAFGLIVAVLCTFASCKKQNGPTELYIDGEEHLSILIGQSVKFGITTDVESPVLTWSVVEENIGGDYTLNGNCFTAKDTAGYVVIQVSSSNGVSDRVTVVINRPPMEVGKKVTFYAVDGVNIVDVRYTDESGKVTPPPYFVGGKEVSWVDADGVAVDFSTLVIVDDGCFTANAINDSVYCTITYWYYGANGEPNSVAVYTIDYANGESISPDTLHSIESEIEALTEKSIANWICNVSPDGTSIDWYAELK